MEKISPGKLKKKENGWVRGQMKWKKARVRKDSRVENDANEICYTYLVAASTVLYHENDFSSFLVEESTDKNTDINVIK